MKKLLIILPLLIFGKIISQNNLRIYSVNGELFKVYINDKVFNKQPEASVLIENIKKDTLYLKIEFKAGERMGFTAYLMDKGKHSSGKEFNYLIAPGNGRLKANFVSMDSIIARPQPLVPRAPLPDTSSMYRNTTLGNLCAITDKKITYFNNKPPNSRCNQPMPEENLSYIRYLMNNANTNLNKIEIARNVCENNCLSVLQFKTILDFIELEVERIKIVKVGYRSVVDTNNKKLLLGAFRFNTSAEELTVFFTKQTGINESNCQIVSPVELMEVFLAKLRACEHDANRIGIIKAEKENYCFGIEDLKAVLRIFTHERDRLLAAKALYQRCVNQQKILEIETEFNSDESVKEFREFVAREQGQ